MVYALTCTKLLQVAAILEALGGARAAGSRRDGAAGASLERPPGEASDAVDPRGGARRQGWNLLADPGREALVEAERRFLKAALTLLQARQQPSAIHANDLVSTWYT